jgi:cyclophilin family peptidyl-prolyl cis-trans isomerase
MAKTGIISSNLGDIKVEFYPEHAPKTVENFRELTNRGFYVNLVCISLPSNNICLS